MANRKTITMDTSHGEGTATAEPLQGAVGPDGWMLTHPWGNLEFYGTAAEARRELRRIVEDNDADEEDHAALWQETGEAGA